MAINTTNTKYFYPPRPGNGAGTFSDNIVGLQTVEDIDFSKNFTNITS